MEKFNDIREVERPVLGKPEPLRAIMAVTRAVVEGQALESTLATIAESSAKLSGSQGAAIVLRREESATGLVVAGSYGLSDSYADWLNLTQPIEMGSGPSGVAAATRQTVVVNDVFASEMFKPWRALAVQEHFRALASIPLRVGGGRRVLGVLNAYRNKPGAFPDDKIDLLLSLADHAAMAVQIAGLLDESRRRVHGLSLVVRSLRTQGHEHANLMHAVYGLLAIGEVDEAKQLITLAEERFNAASNSVEFGVDNSVIAGFLFAEATIAGSNGIDLQIDPRSRVSGLPATVTELDVVTILGNLIQNAIDSLADLSAERRRIRLLISDHDQTLLINLRDWGNGVPEQIVEDVFKAGYSSKSEHVGIGLALVSGIVHTARGEISLAHDVSPGAEFTVRIPF